MSDDAAKHFETPPEEPAAPTGRSITLSATLHPNSQVECSIPKNKIVAGGLLTVLSTELAKLEVLGALAQQQQVAASRGGINGLLKRMNGG